ncbi:MAG: phosphate acetyltransferase [Campylobacterota bacterium]|nr:phosphate acetyltransferase [Campylobacterota bacterium]
MHKIKSLYISSLEESSNSLVVSIGMMQFLKQNFQKVAYFRPIIQDIKDNNINFMLNNFNLKQDINTTYGFTVKELHQLVASKELHKVYETLIKKFQSLQNSYNFVLIEGDSKEFLSTILDFDINLDIAKHLNSSFISVLNGYNKTLIEIDEDMKIEQQNIKDKDCPHFATFVNNINKFSIDNSKNKNDEYLKFFIPYINDINKITMSDVKDTLKSKLLFGTSKNLNQKISDIKIASMNVDNFLERVKEENLIIVSGDRSDIILSSLSSIASKNIPHISGLVLTGGIKPKESILSLLDGFKDIGICILTVDTDTYDTAINITNIKPSINYKNYTKIALILGVFSKYINNKLLVDRLNLTQTDIMTPIMFEYNLFERARKNKKHIVLNESNDDRILRASEILLHSKVVDITLLGDMVDIKIRAQILGINLDKANIIDPQTSSLLDEFSDEFYRLRKDKGILKQQAYDILSSNYTYFATMMVHLGYVDGMVSGAVGTTADTVRPALQIIKTKKDIDIVSSIFFMCLDTKVLVYGDCAINPSPNSKELAQIAISSANTAKQFGIEPKVAMLSYSTGDSGFGEDVELVANATKEVISNNPSLIIEGPIQFDAAIDKQTALKKSPNGKLQGDATVLIFPDLNTGNNTYKAVQRSSGAVAIGPILQGLNKPVNDLSRGCKVVDIVNTVAITAIQAQRG